MPLRPLRSLTRKFCCCPAAVVGGVIHWQSNVRVSQAQFTFATVRVELEMRQLKFLHLKFLHLKWECHFCVSYLSLASTFSLLHEKVKILRLTKNMLLKRKKAPKPGSVCCCCQRWPHPIFTPRHPTALLEVASFGLMFSPLIQPGVLDSELHLELKLFADSGWALWRLLREPEGLWRISSSLAGRRKLAVNAFFHLVSISCVFILSIFKNMNCY